MLTLGIILIISGISLFLATLSFDRDIFGVIAFSIISLLIFIGTSILINRKPTEDDILKDKATYQETLHIINNDTIKTYKIVWKEK